MTPGPSLRRHAPDDAGVSEVLGSVLLTATAVVLLSGFGLVVLSTVHSTDVPPAGAFALEAEDGATTATLRYVSGSSFALDEARVVLLIEGAERLASHRLDAPAVAGRYAPGDRLLLDVSGGPLEDGDEVTALVVDVASGKLVGMTRTTVLGPASLPAYVGTQPTITSTDLSPGTLVADGRSLADLRVGVASTYGLDLIERVFVDLTPLGGPREALLRDDGQGGDALAADGTWSLQLAASDHDFVVVPSTETVALRVTVRDVLGKTATTTVLVALESPPQGKVTTGAKWRDLPPSGQERWVNLTNVTLRDAAALGADQVQLRVSDLLDSTKAWTALVAFADPTTCGGSPGVASITLSRDGVAGSVTYAPDPGPCFALGDLTDLNLADVPSSLDASGNTATWTTSGPAGAYVYAAAGLSGTNEATITFLGDTVSPSPTAVGLAQADLTWARVSAGSPLASFTTGANLLAVTVDAGGSTDPEGDALTYAWDWGDGQTTPASATATAGHTYATAGTYAITLTVTDAGGSAGTSTRSVTVNRNPAASFTHASSGLTVTATSTSTDPDGHALTHAWEWGDSTTGTGASATRTYALAGTYEVNLTVTDAQGASNRTTALVTVPSGPNGLPTAGLAANATSGNEPMDVRFTLTGDDADGAVSSWTLTFGDGGSTSGTTLPATADRAYAGGTYQANLTVTDDRGGVAGASVNLTVNQRPTASLSADVTGGPAPLAVTFTLAGGDADGTVASWSLAYGDGSSMTGTTLPATLPKTYAAEGTYVATLTVTDDQGATRTSAVTITVSSNQAPTASITANRTAGHAPLDVQLTLSGSDADGSVASWTLQWGDGTSTSGVGLPTSRTHQYAAGAYQANLTVTDNGGASTTTSVALTVNARPTAALAITGTSGLQVTASGAGSADPDGTVTWYNWDWGDGQTSNTTTPTASHTYAAPGTYTVRLTVVDDKGAASLASAGASATAGSVPGAPQSLAATRGNGSVTLSWSAPATDGGSPITGYHVYRGTASGATTWLATLGPNTTFTVNGLTNGQAYVFNVTAQNAVGQGASSNEATATPATVPNPPATLAATAGSGNVTLAWTAGSTGGSPVTGYQVWRGTASGSLSLLATVGTNTTFTDLSVSNGTTYHYHVRAVNALGMSSPSVERSASPTSTVEVNCGNMAVTSGTISSCADLQFEDLTYATFQESGGTPPRLFQAQFSLNVTGLTGAKTLQFNGHRGNAPEDLLVQVWNATSGAWETKITMPASTTSATTFNATVYSSHHFPGGVFTIRLIDPNTLTGTGSDSNFSSWLVDFVRLVTT